MYFTVMELLQLRITWGIFFELTVLVNKDDKRRKSLSNGGEETNERGMFELTVLVNVHIIQCITAHVYSLYNKLRKAALKAEAARTS